MSYQGKKNIPKITVSNKRGIMHASVAVGTLMAGVAKLSVFTAPRILRIFTLRVPGLRFFPSFVRLQEAAGAAL